MILMDGCKQLNDLDFDNLKGKNMKGVLRCIKFIISNMLKPVKNKG